jgi:signal transduction histidine kinase
VPSGPGAAGLGVDEVLSILSRVDDTDLAELVELAARVCDSDAAGITIQRGGEYHVPITHGLSPLVCSAQDTFCRATMQIDEVFTVEDATKDPRFAAIGWVDGRLATTRFYASAPLYAPGGEMVGRLCVIDPEPKVLTSMQRRSLRTLGLSATKLIELRLLRAGPSVADLAEGGPGAATVVSHLAAELSHDLRVPLSSIIASVEMLEDELQDHPSGAVHGLLDRALRSADRMGRMLEQNMGLAAPSAPPVDVDLNKVMQQLLLDSVGVLEPVGAVVEVGDLPVVHGTPDDMYSVLQNLISNAVKFRRPNVPVVVRVSARRTANGWRVAVSDNGVGIPEHRRIDVFSLFSRVDSGVAGHGIGLATVARIIASHHGRVGAGAAAGGGAEIWFELPDPKAELAEAWG